VSDDSELTPKDHWWAKISEDLRAQEAEARRLAAHPRPRLVASTPQAEALSDQAQALAKIFAKAKFDRRFKVIANSSGEDGQG
jgi:hypothetical protein